MIAINKQNSKYQLKIKTTKSTSPCIVSLVLIIDYDYHSPNNTDISIEESIQVFDQYKKNIKNIEVKNIVNSTNTHFEYIINEFSCGGGGCGSALYQNRKYLENIYLKISSIPKTIYFGQVK